ncbi:hypothetical protein [Campylobacter canadensis]|uniref:hypothetical protein n=1 Tax=Campylobacter canadensis TaxID=449520 RepID=UPI001CCBED9F|nr:hypothetical protein [Campylobacter canadensis]
MLRFIEIIGFINNKKVLNLHEIIPKTIPKQRLIKEPIKALFKLIIKSNSS